MLKEVSVKQIEGQPLRRWFQGEKPGLTGWLDEVQFVVNSLREFVRLLTE